MPQTPEEIRAYHAAHNAKYHVDHREEICQRKHDAYAALSDEDHKREKQKRRDNYAAKSEQIKVERKGKRLANLAEEQAKANAWRAANPDKVKNHQRVADQNRRDKHIADKRIRYANRDIEADRERRRVWAIENPDKVQAHHKRRKALIRGAEISDLTAAQWRMIQEHFEYRCVYCAEDCPECLNRTHDLTQDHLIPVSQGGNHTVSNIVPACLHCNTSKHDGPPPKLVEPMML